MTDKVYVNNDVSLSNRIDANWLNDVNRSAYSFSTTAAMTAATAPTGKLTVFVRGRVTENDGGGGLFEYDTSSSATANGGTIFRPDSLPTTGRWIRCVPYTLNVKFFGAVGDGTTNDTAAIVAATAVTTSTLFFPKGNYIISKQTQLGVWGSTRGITLVSDGATFTFDPAENWIGTTPWSLFAFNTCTDIVIRGTWLFNGPVVTSDFGGGTLVGCHAFFFASGCKRVKIDTVKGFGIGQAVQFDRLPTVTVTGIGSVGAGGTGYTVGDVLTATTSVRPTSTGFASTVTPPTFTVATVSSGVVTGVTVRTTGTYAVADLPQLQITDDGISVTGGTGTGAKLNIQLSDADLTGTTQNEEIVIDCIEVDTCWYGLSFVYGGRGVVVNRLKANNVYRSFIAYGGFEDAQINCTFRNHYGDCFNLGSGYGLGWKNIRVNLQILPANALGGHNASKMRISWANNYPATFSGLNLNVSCDYGVSNSNAGGSLLEIDKADNKGRGRVFQVFSLRGSVTNGPNDDSGLGGNLLGTNLSLTYTTADVFGEGWVFGPLVLKNTAPMSFDPTVKPINFIGVPGYDALNVTVLRYTDGITAPGAITGYSQQYVDVADGSLKEKFGSGVTKTLTTNP